MAGKKDILIGENETRVGKIRKHWYEKNQTFVEKKETRVEKSINLSESIPEILSASTLETIFVEVRAQPFFQCISTQEIFKHIKYSSTLQKNKYFFLKERGPKFKNT